MNSFVLYVKYVDIYNLIFVAIHPY